MNLTASHIYNYHSPSPCELRIYLQSKGEPKAEPGPFVKVLRRLGEQHEALHLSKFEDVTNLQEVPIDDRFHQTIEAVKQGAEVIYQPILMATAKLNTNRTVIGQPDFFIREGSGYIIRDCKISRRISERDHPEILRQLELYGWLYEQTFGEPP